MSSRANAVLILLVCTVLGTSCQESDGPESHDKNELAPQSLGKNELALQSVLDEVIAKDEIIRGVALHVEAPGVGLSWDGAAGMANRAFGIALTPQHPVRIASNTKTFVAAAILRLWEEGRLDLDDPIAGNLSNDFVQVLEEDGYHPDAITIRHLLTHTSGLFDYATSDAFEKQIEANVRHRWTRAEQLEGAMDWSNPYGKQGEVYRYSDTGYILLGEILERVTELPMGMALRELIGYEKLGLTSTWLETKESRPPGVPDRAHQFDGPYDTYRWNPSFDLYGGGGLVSTVGDLARFMRGIFTERVYRQTATAEMMLSTVALTSGGASYFGHGQVPGTYRMGVEVTEIDGLTVYVQLGYWGTLAA
jgi:D-alanyl-D-alanine carboxypeptidase